MTITRPEHDFGDFDRTVCPCGIMHAYCTDCGKPERPHQMTHHPTAHHDMFRGHWVTCACTWSGPAYPTRHLANTAHQKHVRDAR